uniref:Capsid protein n=1 Tax=Dulem virus 76 TaxID=3145787 RepID=A0AAU8B7P0_9VIRU
MARRNSRWQRKFSTFKRKSKGKITLKNHRHAVKPMSGLTSIPLRFRGRRIS